MSSPQLELGAVPAALRALCSDMVGAAVAGIESTALEARVADPGAAICDTRGRVVWSHSVEHVAEMSSAAHQLMSAGVGAGDAIVLNDPFGGGSRVLDLYALAPIALENGSWMAIARMTVADLGGNCFGGYNPEATEVWAEGVRIPPVVMQKNGKRIRDMAACISLNSRTPTLLESQLSGLLTALDQAREGLAGLDLLGSGVADELLALGADHGRARVATLPITDGARMDVPLMNPDGGPAARIEVAVATDGTALRLDMTAADPTAGTYVNMTRASAASAVLAVLGSTIAAPNQGLLDVIRVKTRTDTVVNGAYPSATCWGRSALRQALPDLLGPTGLEDPEPIVGRDGRIAPDLAELLRQDEQAAQRAGGGRRWQ